MSHEFAVYKNAVNDSIFIHNTVKYDISWQIIGCINMKIDRILKKFESKVINFNENLNRLVNFFIMSYLSLVVQLDVVKNIKNITLRINLNVN